MSREPGHLLPPARAPTGRTTRPSSSPGQPPGTPLRRLTNHYDTSEEREVLPFWEQVNVKLYSPRLPLARPVGWGADKAGRRKRLYDAPRTPPGRLLDTDALTKAQKTDLISYRNQLNPACHHPPHHRVLGRPHPSGQGQDRRAPASPSSPASCPTSTRRTTQESLLTTTGLRGHSYMRYRRHFAAIMTRGTQLSGAPVCFCRIAALRRQRHQQ